MALNLNETATLSLKLNNGDVSKSIDELNTKAKELKKTINDIEKEGGKGSENWQKYKNELKDVQTATSQLKKEVDLTTLNYGQLESLIKQLNKELKGLKPGTDEFVAASKRLGEAEKQFKAVKSEVDDIKKGGEDLGQPGLWSKITGGVGNVQKAFQAFMALQILGYIIDIGKSIFETTAKFEKYGKVLETALGSQKDAKSAMEALKKLGAETAFSVDELTEGYVKMVNRGMRPTQKEMVAMTDLAASQGKTFDMLVEAALDAQTGEFERLKEFGMKASKEGDNVTLSFKGMNQTVKNTPEAIQGAIVAFGQMKGVGGQNAEMMGTLAGKTSNLGDSMDALMVAVGDRLKPVFMFLLNLMSTGVEWMLKIFESTEPVVTVFGDLFDAVGALLGSLQPMIQRIFPNMISGGTALNDIMKVVALAFRAVITPVQAGIAVFIAMGQTFGGVLQAGRALELFLSGDVIGGKAAWEQAKNTFTQVGDTAKANFNAIANGWKNAMVDHPKQVAPEAVFAAKQTEEQRQEAMSSEQKKALAKQEKEAEKARKKEQQEHEKALAEREKANEAAAKKIADTEAEIYLNSVKDELKNHEVKLMQKRDKEAEAIMATKADESLKNDQIKALDEKLLLDIQALTAEHRKKELAAEAKAADERLQANNQIREQERKATLAILDFKELQAGNNAKKLIQIDKERADVTLTITKQKLNDEETAEIAKAANDMERRIAALGDVKDKTAQEQQIKEQFVTQVTAINTRFRANEQTAEAQHSATLLKIEQDEKAQRQARRDAFSNAFKALLAGDLSTFADCTSKIVSGEQEAWQKRMSKNMESYDQIANMAKQGVDFLNKLTQERLDKEIAASKKETETKIADGEKRMEAAIKAAEEQAEAEKEAAGDSADKIEEIEEKLAESKADIRTEFEKEADAIRKDGATKEKDLAKQKWEADKRAQIATAIISGAQAALKALASGIFPVNLVFAGIIAGLTAVQVAKIKNQPAPAFEHGGFVAKGGRHGTEYGRGGIALVDRGSGREVGEMEGDEAIISREQTAANWPIISKMFSNARTPGKRSTPVLQDRGPAFREGGVFTSPYWKKEMYLFGSKKAKREAEEAARQAEEEARRAEAEANASIQASMSAYEGPTSGDGGDQNGTADAASYNGQADAAAANAKKMAEEQLQLLEDIGEAIETMDKNIQQSNKSLARELNFAMGLLSLNVKNGLDSLATTTKSGLDGMATEVGGLKGSINAVEGAVREVKGAVNGVEGAVWGTNQAGRLEALIGAISSLKG